MSSQEYFRTGELYIIVTSQNSSESWATFAMSEREAASWLGRLLTLKERQQGGTPTAPRMEPGDYRVSIRPAIGIRPGGYGQAGAAL